MLKSKNSNKGDRQRLLEHVSLVGAQAEVVQRYGSATKEFVVAYSGKDNEINKTMKKGLKSISESIINDNNVKTCINSQAGFSAEAKTVAQENAERIIAGNRIRSTRTDDLPKCQTANGQVIGGTNDQLFDIVSIDKAGSYIEGTGRQLKYVGDNPKRCCQMLLSKKYDKYREAEASIEIPKDFYEDVQKELSSRIDKTKRQIQAAELEGKTELVQSKETALDRLEKTRSSLRKGRLSKEEAIVARLHPRISTAMDISQVSHRAGVDAAKSGAIIGGGMSFIRNAVAVIKGDEDPPEAVASMAGDTVTAAGLSYATGFIGSALKGGMQNANNNCIRVLSKTNLPGTVVTAALETGKTLMKYSSGQITGIECLSELGEKGAAMTASALGATVGQTVIPFPIIGGLVGGMFGYTLSTMYYENLLSALKEEQMAHEQRLLIEAECEEAIQSIREYRLEIELAIRNYLSDYTAVFDSAFNQIHASINTQNVNLLIDGANSITKSLGGEALFSCTDELDSLMADNKTIML